MLKTIGIIDGLLTTDRQRRNASRSLGGKTVLEWVTRQLTDSEFLDGVIVITDNLEENMFIKMMTPLDIPVVETSAKDTLQAIAKALEKFQSKNCVLIGLDWPLIDPDLINRLVLAGESNPKGKYAAFHFEHTVHSIQGRPYGMFAEWYDTKAIYEANRKATDPLHREYPGLYFLEQIPQDAITLISAPRQFDQENLRLTIENEDDWDNMVMIFESIDVDHIQWHHIADIVLRQPHVRERRLQSKRKSTLHVK